AAHQEGFVEHLLEAAHDRVSRIVGNAHRQFNFIAQVSVDAAEKRAAAGENDAPIVNITCDFRRKFSERHADTRHDLTHYFLRHRIDFTRTDLDRARHARQHVTAVNRNLAREVNRNCRRRDFQLEAFRSSVADEQTAMTPHVIDYRRVDTRAPDPIRTRTNDLSTSHDCNVRCSTSNVYDRRSMRIAGADTATK